MGDAQNPIKPPNKTSWGKRVVKYTLILLLVLILVSVISLFFVNRYLESNKTKILNNLEFLNNGTVTFDEVNISVYRDFPSATITIQNIRVQDSLFEQHQNYLLEVGQLKASASLQELLKKRIFLQSILLKDGTINIHTDSSNYSNLKSLLPVRKTKKGDKKHKERTFDVESDGLILSLSNMAVHLTDAIKTTSIHGLIQELNTQLNIKEEEITATIALEIEVEEMAFKKEKGSFVANSKLKGNLSILQKDSLYIINPFTLAINEEPFVFSANINTTGRTHSIIKIENKATRFDKVLPLLPSSIQKNLLPYQISSTFYSKTEIRTTFKSKTNPIVEVMFQMPKNDLVVHKTPFENATLKGRFVNRIYDDERALTEGKRRIKLIIDELRMNHGPFTINSESLLITSTPETGPRLRLGANIKGEATAISDWLENDEFFFNGGHFDLNTTVVGPLNNFDELLISSEAGLALSDFSVIFGPANVNFPFEELTLTKKYGDAFFTIANSELITGNKLFADGSLINFPALVLQLLEQQASSEIHIKSPKLEWENFFNLFSENGYIGSGKPKTEREKKRSMKETIKGIYDNLQPRLSVEVDTLKYYDILELHDFKTGVFFENEHTIVLDNTSFKYDEGSVDFSGFLDIRDPHLTPFKFELHTKALNLKKLLPALNYFNIDLLSNLSSLPDNFNLNITHEGILDDEIGLIRNTSKGKIDFKVDDGTILEGKIKFEPSILKEANRKDTTLFVNTKVELEGDPIVFNTFFKTENFFFYEGRFFTQFEYEGELGTPTQFLNNGFAKLRMEKSRVHYKPVEVRFPLTQIDVIMNNGNADFNFLLRSDSLQEELHFVGNLKNISELVIGNTGEVIQTDIEFNSPKITWQHFLNLFLAQPGNKKEEVMLNENGESLKATIQGLFTTFNPTVGLNIDTFIYSEKLQLYGLGSTIFLKDEEHLVFEDCGWNFHGGGVTLDAKIDLEDVLKTTPFETNIHARNIDVAGLLESVDYVSLPSFREIDKLSGRITMNLELSGIIETKGKGLVTEATKGIFDFDLREVELEGFSPLDSIAAKIRMRKRFKELKFAPIANKISILGNELDIPLMEIQSNAIHLFIEGNLSYDDKTNLWISVPLSNLKKPNLDTIPPKLGYAIPKRKVHVEVTSDENGANQFKFRPTKRRFYKDRGILDQYRKNKQGYRRIRQSTKKLKKKLDANRTD